MFVLYVFMPKISFLAFITQQTEKLFYLAGLGHQPLFIIGKYP